MVVWIAAFLSAGVFLPPDPRPRVVVLTIASTFIASARFFIGGASRFRNVPPSPGSRRANRMIVRFILLVSTAITLWMSAGLARERYDFNHAVPARSRGIRAHLLDSLDDHYLTERSKKLLSALVLADRSGLDRTIREVYTYLGIAHFLALSGLHLGIIAIAVSRCLSLLQLSRTVREFILLFILIVYAAVAGFPPSLQRALALAGTVIASRAIGIKTDLFSALILGSCVLVLIDISLPLMASFQLSFTAVCAIALVALPIQKTFEPHLPGGVIGRLVRVITCSVIITASIQFVSLPLVLTLFKRAPLYAPLMNLVMVLPVTGLLYLGLPYCVVQWGAVRAVLSIPVNILADILWDVPLAFSHRPHPAILAGDIEPLSFAFGAALVAFSLKTRCGTRRITVIAALTCLLLSMYLGRTEEGGAFERPAGSTRTGAVRTIHWFNNTCTMYMADERTLVLERGIGRSQARVIVRDLWSNGIGAIEYLVTVQGTRGRKTGILYILERVRVGEMLCSPYLFHSTNELEARTRRLGLRVRTVSGSEEIDAGLLKIEITGPVYPPPAGRAVTEGETDLRVRIQSKSPGLT